MQSEPVLACVSYLGGCDKNKVMEAVLPPVPSSLARARRMVGDSVDAPREAVQNAQLVLTELLANEIKHGRYAAGDPLVCTVKQRPSTLRIEVRHSGPPFDLPKEPVPTPASLAQRATGWGLALITRLADRWGVSDVRGARQVWAEIDLGAYAPRAAVR